MALLYIFFTFVIIFLFKRWLPSVVTFEDNWVFHVQATMPLDYEQLINFLRRCQDVMIVIDKNDFNLTTQRRNEDGSVQAYVSLNVKEVKVWNEEDDQLISLREASGNPNLHISLAYEKVFPSYGVLHNRSSRARSYLGGLQGDVLWGSYTLSVGEAWVCLRIKQTSEMYGVLSVLGEILEEDFNGYHVTVCSTPA